MARATQTKPAQQQTAAPAQSSGELVLHTARMPYHAEFATEFSVTERQWKVLVDSVFPSAETLDAVVMALAYCQHRKLDIFKRPVHIVPMYDAKRGGMVETVWPSISELRTTATRTGAYAGCDEAVFGPMTTKTFKGRVGRGHDARDEEVHLEFPEWCQMTFYRIVQGVRCAFVGPKVYWLETYATIGRTELPNNMWRERFRGQLEKCAEAAGLRRAFPEEIGNEYAAEEMEGRRISDVSDTVAEIVSRNDRDAAPPRRADAQAAAAAQQEQQTNGADVQDAEYTEVNEQEEEKPQYKEPHEIDVSRPGGRTMSYRQFADEYIRCITTYTREPGDVLRWGDKNKVLLDTLYKGNRSESDRVRNACDRRVNELRRQSISTGAETQQIIPDKKEPERPKDDGPPKRTAAPPSQKQEARPAAVPADPEEVLGEISVRLDALEDPNNIEACWEHIENNLLPQLDFPGDKEAAQAMLRKTEKRLGAN